MKNKGKINGASILTIANFFVGLFVGAGFMSGQELWQYFGKYKGIGVIFLILGSLLQGFLGYFIVEIARRKNVYHFDVLPTHNSKILRRVFSVSELVFVFFTISIMIAGANSLYESIFFKSGFWFSLLFVILVGITAFFGIDGVVLIFKIIMPFMLIVSAVIFFESFYKFSFSNLKIVFEEFSMKDALNALYACIIYIFHNVYLSLALLVPFSKKINDNQKSKKGFILSSVMFIVFSLFVLTPLIINSNYAVYPLPLLELSKTISPFIFFTFSFFLCVAMFLACLSNAVAIVNSLHNKNRLMLKNKALIIAVCMLLAFTLSRVGFKSLILIMYPISGYLGLIFIIRLLFSNRKAKIK